MTDNKSLADIARAAWLDCPLDEDHWEDTAKAIRRAIIDECIQSVGQSSWKHEGDDAYSKGMDQGARHQVDACIEALEGLKGETDV